MRSRYWSFVDACDETQSIRAVKDLLISALREIGVDGFAIVTHAPIADLRSLGVVVHNWPTQALDFLYSQDQANSSNPLFAEMEDAAGPLYWPSLNGRRDPMKKSHRVWFDRLRRLVGHSEGVSHSLRSVIVGASCSMTSAERLDLDRVRLCTRMCNYAYQQILALQKPKLSEPERLTAREHEFLHRATILGESPSDVASQLGVKISTVRTLRQKAKLRLDASSQEQATWHMIETGQLFRSGRKRRLRRR